MLALARFKLTLNKVSAVLTDKSLREAAQARGVGEGRAHPQGGFEDGRLGQSHFYKHG